MIEPEVSVTAPIESLTVPMAKVPPFTVNAPAKAPLPLKASVPAEIVVNPVYVLAALSVKVPAPDFVKVPVPVPIIPVIAVSPAPSTVKPKVLPEIAPRVSKVPVFAAKVPPPALSVVAPKVIPAVPEVVVASLPIVKVCAPIDKVPKVCVTPAPAARRSEVICTAPEIVVLRLKLSPVSLASSSVPPESAKVPAPSADALVVARSVPALTVVVPLYVFTPERVSVPAPLFVNPPVPARIPLSTLLPVPPTVSKKPPLVTPFNTVRALAELFVQDCAAPSVRVTRSALTVALPIVTAPAELSTTIPEAPRVKPCPEPVALPKRVVVAVLVPKKFNPRTD